MSEKILHFDTYHGALCGILSKIKNRKVDLSTKHILLVPEKDTLKAEQRLFSGGGAFDVEVYSMPRWFRRLGGGNILPPSGAVMILKDILYDMELGCFFRSKGFDGFCARAYDTFCDLESDCVDIESLSAGGGLGLKLDDLKNIYKEYKRRTEGMYVGKSGKIKLITESLHQKNHLKNTHVYAWGFGRLSGAERQLFELISQKALSFTHAEVRGCPRIKANVEVYKASSTVGSLKAAAGRIRHLLKIGEAIESICVVSPPAAFPQAKRIFDEYGLPHYIDHAAPLPTSRLSEYLRLLFDLKKLSRREFVLLSKNPLGGIDPNDSDVFENYCESFLIDYLGFSRPFTLTDSAKNPAAEQARLAAAERVRLSLFRQVSTLWDRLNAIKSAREFSPIIVKVLEDACERYQKNLSQKNSTESSTNILNKSNKAHAAEVLSGLSVEKNKILGVLVALDRFLCEGTLDKKRLQFLIGAFLEGANSETLERLPRSRRCVVIGDAGIFRGEKFSHTFVIGFSEGVIPKIETGRGLITRAECETLNKMGAQLPVDSDLAEQNEYELLQLFAASDNLFLSYVESGEMRPSPLLFEVISEAESVRHVGTEYDLAIVSEFGKNRENIKEYNCGDKVGGEESGCCNKAGSAEKSRENKNTEGFCDDDCAENYDEIVRLAGSSSAGLEILILTKNNPSRLTSSLYAALGKPVEKYLREKSPAKNSIPFAAKEVSASRLQSYFLCPYKHFVEYGLLAARKKSGKADGADIGTAVHKVNQLYSRCGFDKDKLEGIIDEVLSGGVYDLKQNERLKLCLKKEIMDVCASFGEKLTRGSFKRVGEEIRFGANERFKGCALGEVTLKGSVDFADSFDGFVRIIDYKTGFAKLDEEDIYYGKTLQLPLYMLAMRENGFNSFAMLYFVFKSGWAENGYFAGFYLADKQLLLAGDPALDEDNPVLPARIKQQKDGSEKITGISDKTAPAWKKAARPKNAAVMDAYLDYAKEVATLAARQINDGNTAPSPLKFDDRCACDFCGYRPACGFKGSFRTMQSAKIVSSDSAENDTEEDVDCE